MKLAALIAVIVRFVECTSYWVTNFDKSRKAADLILRDHFDSVDEALNALESAIIGKEIPDDNSNIECSFKLIQLMKVDKFPIEKGLELLDMLLPLVIDEEGQQAQAQRLAQALRAFRLFMPSAAFDALLQRPALAYALRSSPSWWAFYQQLSVPVIMSMLRIGCRLGQRDIIDVLNYDVSLYNTREPLYDLTLGAQTACSILFIPERLDWTVITKQVPANKTRLRSELIDVLAVRKAAEKFIATYIELLIGTKGLVLPNELMYVIRSYIIMLIGQEFDKIVEKYSNIFVLTLW